MHIDLKLGLSCNNKCRHCVMEPVRQRIESENRPLDTEYDSIESLLAKLQKKEMTSVTLTGGEPTLRNDFHDILGFLAKTSLSVTVQTNGRLLSRPEAVTALGDLPRRDILFVVALHGADPELHDTITRVHGSFQETVAGIAVLRSLGFPVCGKMVLSRYNTESLTSTLAYMHELGLKEAVVAFPHAEDFPLSTLRDVMPRYEAVKKELRIFARSLQPQPHVTWETIPFCVFPEPSFFPYSQDLLYLKEHLHNKNTIIEMSMTGKRLEWEKSRKSIKSKAAPCGLCLMEYACEGVWSEYLDLYEGDDLEPIQDQAVIQAFLGKL